MFFETGSDRAGYQHVFPLYEAIIAARRDGLFIDLFNFAKRADKRQFNRRTIDALIRAGAFGMRRTSSSCRQSGELV